MSTPSKQPGGAIEVGVFLPLVGLDWPTLLARARQVEQLGYHSLWLDDHFWFPGAPDRAHLEVWTALSALAVATERLTLGPLVLCQSYRSPGLVAKMAASLSEVSGERLVLGLGSGWMEEEYRAYGYPLPRPGVRVQQLGEALAIVRALTTEPRATVRGAHYAVSDAPMLPKPARLPILLGGAGEKLLRLVAEHADIWNCPNPAWRELAAKRDRLRRHCETIGRDPSAVRISEQVMVVVGRTEEDVARAREHARATLGGFTSDFDADVHVGTPQRVADSLRARTALGVSLFAVMFGDFGSAEQIELFAREVLPLLGAED